MACSHYRQMLIKLSEQLDGAASEQIGSLFGLPPAQRDEIRGSSRPSSVLIGKLEQRGAVKEKDVSDLIEGLKALRLVAASNIVEEYRDTMVALQSIVGNEYLCSEHNAELGFFCFTCDNGICYQCFLGSHEKHDVITMETVEQEQAVRYDKNLSLITESKAFLIKARESLQNIRQTTANRVKLFDFVLGSKTVEPVSVSGISSLERALDEIEDLLQSKESSLKLSSQTTKMLPLHRVKMQNEITKQITRVGKDISQLKTKVETTGSHVAGLNWPLVNQLIIVLDQRDEENKITLRCVNPRKLKEVYFEFSIKSDEKEKLFPLVVSPITYWIDGADSVLLASGQSLYVVRLHFKGDKYVSPKSETTAQRLALPSGSYIMSIDAHNRGSSRKYDFIVSINTAATIFRFNGKLNKVSEVDVSDIVSTVDVASCVDETYAVIDSERNHIVLIHEAGRGGKRVGQLTLKEEETEVYPLSVLWRGSAWIALWIKFSRSGENREARWIISVHERDGKLMFCSKSEKFTEVDFPICFTRFEFNVALAMSSGVMKFCTSKEGQICWPSGCFDFN